MSRLTKITLLIAIALAHLAEAAAPSGAKPRPRDTVKVTPAREKIIEGAMKYIASKQKSNGSWGESSMERGHPAAITGYALIALQAAGNLPGEGPHGKTVKKGMNYLR